MKSKWALRKCTIWRQTQMELLSNFVITSWTFTSGRSSVSWRSSRYLRTNLLNRNMNGRRLVINSSKISRLQSKSKTSLRKSWTWRRLNWIHWKQSTILLGPTTSKNQRNWRKKCKTVLTQSTWRTSWWAISVQQILQSRSTWSEWSSKLWSSQTKNKRRCSKLMLTTTKAWCHAWLEASSEVGKQNDVVWINTR